MLKILGDPVQNIVACMTRLLNLHPCIQRFTIFPLFFLGVRHPVVSFIIVNGISRCPPTSLLILIYHIITVTCFDQMWSSSGQPNYKNVNLL